MKPDPTSEELIRALIAEPERIGLHRQPIVDLARGEIAGFEVLARFAFGPPDTVIAAAANLGLGTELEMAIIERALTHRGGLSPNAFVSLNVSPQTLADERFTTRFASMDLAGVVLEVTEHVPVVDYGMATRAAAMLRDRGAMLAVDDAGAGYASLRHVLAMRPQFVKVDRSLIEGLPLDPAKRAVLEVLGRLTSRMDAWLVAEGIETDGELREVLALGVPLGQGYGLARPGPGFPPLSAHARTLIGNHPRPPTRDTVDGLASPVPPITAVDAARAVFEAYPESSVVAVIDGEGRPRGVVRRAELDAGRPAVVEPLFVEPNETLAAVARRAAARSLARRFEAAVCRDSAGLYRGLVEVDRLLDALARLADD